MSLLDTAQSAGGGLLNFLNAIPQAAQGQFAQAPAIDPELAQFLTPEQIAVAQANHQRNMAAGMQGAAMRGASLAGAGAMAAQSADPQFQSDVMQSVKDAMLIHQMRLLNQDVSDPRDMIRQGAALSRFGLPGGDAMITAGTKLLENSPENQGMLSAAKTAAESARINYLKALQRGDTTAASGYQAEFQTQTKLLNLLRNGGVQKVLPDGSIVISLPEAGTSTNVPGSGAPATQAVIPGAPGAQRAVAAGRALGGAAATIVPVDKDGSTQQMPAPAAVAALGGGAGGAAPPARPVAPPAAPNPAMQPVAPTGARAPMPGAAPTAPALPPTLAARPEALSDVSYRLKTPQTPLGRGLDPAQKKQMEAVGEAMSALPAEGEEATRGAATTLTYIKAAQAVMNSKNGPPTGVLAPVGAAISRGMSAVGMTSGDWAAKSQLLVKYLGNLALSNAKATYGPRITQNEVRLQLEELSPSQSMQDGTINEMLDKLGRISQYAVDSADRSRYYLQAGNDPRDFAKWNQAYFPMAESTTPAPAGAHPAEIQALLDKYPGAR